ncbi:hypothetical protein QP439_07565 [Streptococcus sp. UMB1203]|uniref:hypothetical protein n=1 Tax=Streptococcus sp. UMB1203 TaxID=3046327 RepID=UPI0025530EE5|nr:hypothetical protein [Streptococcus sp. UMB1203]MDK7204175.1 hypothetical protein [Streptococcus sp. UMB1203]
MFKDTVNFFYDLIIHRLKTRRDILSKKNSSQTLTFENLSSYIDSSGIEVSYDIAMIKHVFGKKIYKNKNPYLIPDSCLSYLTNRLGFDNEYQLLWEDIEKDENIHFIFLCLLKECFWDKNEMRELLNHVLTDYIPYAKESPLFDMILFPSKYKMKKISKTDMYVPLYFYGVSEDEVIEQFSLCLDDAIEFLFKKCHKDFKKIFINFIKEHGTSLKKINKKLEDFVNNELKQLLLQYSPKEDSLGLRVKNIMISDWFSRIDLVMALFDNRSLDDKLLFEMKLYNNSMNYVKDLEDLQKKLIGGFSN